MKFAAYISFFLLVLKLPALSQSHQFYNGLSLYFSSKYHLASEQFSIAETNNTDVYKADIYYLNGICEYFSQNYSVAIQKLDESFVYWERYKDTNYSTYFDLAGMLKYKALAYQKLENTEQEIATLRKLTDQFDAPWAISRLQLLVTDSQ